MKKNMKKHFFIKRTVCIILIIGCIITGVYSYYGGLGTGKCANVNEYEKYAVTVEELSIPEQTKIVALGEATHGNKEFQQLKLDIFKIMVEDYGVRAFSLEGDYGGCEAVGIEGHIVRYETCFGIKVVFSPGFSSEICLIIIIVIRCRTIELFAAGFAFIYQLL